MRHLRQRKSLRYGQASAVSAHAVNVRELDKALASITGFPVAEKIRFKYSVDRLGLLRR